jgi:uncharacterized protein YjbJ (UPF0337 family)
MNWNMMEERWHTIVGSAKQRWDKFSDQELHALRGKRDLLIQKLKEKYGMSHEQAEKEVNDFQASQTEAANPQTRTSGGGH